MDKFSDKAQDGLYAAEVPFSKLFSVEDEGYSNKGNDIQEMEIAQLALTEIDFRLAYSSEKLVNLHVLYIYLLAQENDLEAMDSKNSGILTNFFEKAMTFDLLSGILDSEVRELDNFMDTLQEEIVDARRKIFSCRHLTEVFIMMEKKLRDSEESVKQFQQQLLELKIQSSQLQKVLVAFQHESWEIGNALNLSENDQLMDMKSKSNHQLVENRRYILQMLEKSLSRELELEKKLAELRKNEELKLKLHYTEQVAFHMEEAAEVVWGRFLESDNAAEVLMGISKGLIGRVQITEFNLNGSIQRENDLNSKVQTLIEQIKTKDAALEKLERSHIENIKENSAEVLALKKKALFLEEERKDFEHQLNAVISENDVCHEQLIEMENFVESLKENIDIAENRAESAEAKVTQLSETNLELTEELNFLKGSASTAEKKVGSLEKQLRELDLQVQNAKVSSEASQEQQNMLYSAIWDMEILIEELKSKVAKAESNKESAEEQCTMLSETNFKLNKELDLLRSNFVSLKTSLDQATNSKLSSAKEINTRSKVIMDMAMQLATERERINKQVDALKRENKSLEEKLKDTKIGTPLKICNNGINNRNEDIASNIDSSKSSCARSSDEEGTNAFNKTFEVGEPSEGASSETQPGSSISANKYANWRKLIFLLVTMIIPLVSVLALCLFDIETFSFLRTFDG
ncbi:PREDICTED: WPP domain-interacting tail-anchored protein 2 isoform X1 [Lupinus angustifolius]|uniref:WPP domain-interacting tail-anchored protein 2 isoform X1 n=3 Tax=Lupinus angustifolius TaxID=3871 RepID=UPI00092F6444|nr:PREDICTED: WPP domain-interacting tail-anchored protein 2 isoform X1 [Lupinus angustifolius]XP_019461565.1 PREDICTED: WPP domain-interacting tail-anchored protein 2 isoform X1 [Lupinus angustifolius]XP_019461566.1 PREDICTED: WPP domain-interacting tail-anchored protein 2 isoform X1 [Lupinus angustifolius]